MSLFECTLIDYTAFPPLENFAACSAQGSCVNGTCRCLDFWTGRSDFLNTEGRDCQVNEIAIIVLWSLNIAQALYSAYTSAPYVKVRYEGYSERKERMRQRGRKEQLRKNRGLLASLLLLFGGFPVMIASGLLRIAKPDERVGVTFGLTLMFFLVKMVFYTANWLYSPALLTSLLKGTNYRKDRMAQLVRINEVGSTLVAILSVTFGAVPFAAYLADGELGYSEQAAYMAYFIGMDITMTAYFVLFTFMRINCVAVLDESIKVTGNRETRILRDKLLTMMKSGQVQAGAQLLIYSLFLFWPYMWNKHDYFLPVSWLAFNKLGRECCQTTIKDSGSRSKRSKRSKESASKDGSADEEGSFEVSRRGLGSPGFTVMTKQGEETIQNSQDEEEYI